MKDSKYAFLRDRTNIFFVAGAFNLSMVVVAPPISSILIERYGSLTTYMMTLPLLIITLLILGFVPDTTAPKETEDTEDYTEPVSGDDTFNKPTLWVSIKENLHGFQAHIRYDLLPVLKSTKILRGLFGVLVVSFSEMLSNVLLQYVHIRFGWKYEKVH
jgi:hypothetical protein